MADSETLNPNDPGDAKLLALKNEIESRPDWPQRKAELDREIFVSPGTQTENAGAPVDKYDVRLARLKASYEAGQRTAQPPETETPASEDSPPDYATAVERFRETLGVDDGPEFQADVDAFHVWSRDTFSDPEDFHRVAIAAEKVLGEKAAAELALKIAREYVKTRRR